MTEIIIAVVSASAFFNFIQFLVNRHDRKKEREKESPEKLILLALAAYRLKVQLKRWKSSTTRTAAEWEIIDNLYRGYSQLHGNGEVKKLYEECAQIPTTE